MIESIEEKRRFAALLTALSDYYKSEISKGVMGLYWEGLRQYDYEAIEKAAWAHTQMPGDAGHWMPKISDLTKILAPNAWLAADEVWARMPKSEADSAMMTKESAEAMGAATALLEIGDKVAARMAFKSAYDRLVDQAKAEGRAPVYFASFGTEKSHHSTMLANAVQAGQIELQHAIELAPEHAPDIVAMVGVKSHPLLAAPTENGKRQIEQIRLMLKLAAS